jgi:2-enoate reductase
MNSKYEHLFQPIQVGPMRLKNRITSAPLGTFLADRGLSELSMAEWARPRARGGAALINIGTCITNRVLPPGPDYCISVGNDITINWLSRVVETIHAYDAKVGIELFPLHKEPGVNFDERDKLGVKQVEIDPTGLSMGDIHELIEDYALAAERVMRAGADSVLFHGAHAFIPAAFFSKEWNERHDEYGIDTFENRMRFTVECLDAIRAKIGNNLAIECRISWTDMTPKSPTFGEIVEFVKGIEDKIDMLHVTKGQLGIHRLGPYIFPAAYLDHGINIGAAARLKKELKIPVAVVGAITIDQAEEAISSGLVDVVAMARAITADRDLPNKARRGQEDRIRPCIRCNHCINRSHNFFLPPYCSVNPEECKEVQYMNYPAPEKPQRVAVVGGGPAGMEAARVAARRGHDVTLFEKTARLGGMLNVGTTASFKEDLRKYLEWSVRETLRDDRIRVRMAVEATPEMIRAEGFETVIVAIGSSPVIPEFTARYPEKVAWVGDVEEGRKRVGNNVVIAGAGMTGCEAALSLAKNGRKITIIDMLKEDQVCRGGTKINKFALLDLLEKAGVRFRMETKLLDVTETGILVESADGTPFEMECDSLVLSLGVTQNLTLADTFKDAAMDYVVIGDCTTKHGTLYNATNTAFAAAMNIG